MQGRRYLKGNRDKTHIPKRLSHFSKSNGALNIVFKYGVFGVLWILLSDEVLRFLVGDFEIYKTLQTYKGGAFVLVTVILVYILINNRENKIRDATGRSMKAIEDLERVAFYDTLTGLPNRLMFADKIKNIAEDEQCRFAIAYVDIDDFKFINDTLGHYAGDEFIKFMGCRISEEISYPNMVARLGGDEFAILFVPFISRDELCAKLENIKSSIGNTWYMAGREFFISMSIGVSVFPYDGYTFDALLKNSDIAMYAAKKEGKNKILFYDEDINDDATWYFQMANNIKRGLDKKEFELYYQPQVELSTGKMVGMEALLRWKHLGKDFFSPSEFIPVAEITGQIYELERSVIENTLNQKKKWEEEGMNNIELSINLSCKSLISNISFMHIQEIFSRYDVNYSEIVIEITETSAISNIDIAIERLEALKGKGLKIALDDFGTGYSSITYLKKLPIDIIKLDKSYTNWNYSEEKDFSIAKFVLLLARDLGFRVIAEGIETCDQLSYLKSINCEYGQGYYLGMPMCLEAINKIIRDNIKIEDVFDSENENSGIA